MERCQQHTIRTIETRKWYPILNTFYCKLRINSVTERLSDEGHFITLLYHKIEAVVQRCSVKKVFLKISQNSQENTYAKGSFFLFFCNFIKKETLALVLSCEFCEIFKNNYFYRTPPMAASDKSLSLSLAMILDDL